MNQPLPADASPRSRAESAIISDHATRSFRTLWISDVHLGWRACEAERLLDFLKHHDADQWYLVGDMVDGWMLKRGWHWPQSHNNIVQKLLRKVRKGSQVCYIPGNHDEFLREFTHLQFGGITLLPDGLHTTATGNKLWILHGDEYDSVVHYAPWLTFIGNQGYDLMIGVGRRFNRLRRALGFREWSLSAYVKHRFKNIVNFITDYEKALAREARRRGADGVVCGHIHKAEIKSLDGIMYYNCGDWVESCTALAEHHDGTLEILNWNRPPSVSVENPHLTDKPNDG
jgi:UDP-2,3-diacylglucosamine pyrophosphatase LpxH